MSSIEGFRIHKYIALSAMHTSLWSPTLYNSSEDRVFTAPLLHTVLMVLLLALLLMITCMFVFKTVMWWAARMHEVDCETPIDLACGIIFMYYNYVYAT